MRKSHAHRMSLCCLMELAQVVFLFLSPEGAMPFRLKMLPTVWSLILWPRLRMAPAMRS